MYIEDMLKSADFTRETDFKERLYQKLNMIRAIRNVNVDSFGDEALCEDQLDNVVAAGGVLPASVSVEYRL